MVDASTPDPHRFFPAATFGEILALQAITKGLSGAAVYDVTTTKGEYILRIHRGDQASWDKLVGMYRLASEHGIAPRLEAVDAAAQAFICAKVTGPSFGAAISQPTTLPAAFQSLVTTIAKLHAIPASGVASNDAPAFARGIWKSESQRPGFPAWALPLGKRLDDAIERMAQDNRKVFSHCDLHVANIIWDGTRVWFVDWEGAGLAHPYLDLATISNFLSLPRDAALGLLSKQEGGTLGDAEAELFDAVRDFARITYGAVFFRLVPDLTKIAFAGRETTPTLGACFALVAAGKLRLDGAEGQASIGAALLSQA